MLLMDSYGEEKSKESVCLGTSLRTAGAKGGDRSRAALPEVPAVLLGRAAGERARRGRRLWREEGGRGRVGVDGRVGAAPRKVHRDARHRQVAAGLRLLLAHLAICHLSLISPQLR